MKFIIKNKVSGFTVLEVVVSISIIMVGLLGVCSLVIQNIQVEVYNRNNLIASMLAQEGLELIRNIRDDNWLADDNWKNGSLAGSPSDIVQDGNYIIRMNGGIDESLIDVDDFNNDNTKLFIKDGFYDHDPTGLVTPFSRLISVSDDDANYITASSTIRWQMKGKTNYYTAVTKLYNWK